MRVIRLSLKIFSQNGPDFPIAEANVHHCLPDVGLLVQGEVIPDHGDILITDKRRSCWRHWSDSSFCFEPFNQSYETHSWRHFFRVAREKFQPEGPHDLGDRLHLLELINYKLGLAFIKRTGNEKPSFGTHNTLKYAKY